MDATETLIFENLVVNLNDLVFYVSASEDELTGNDTSTNVVVADFSALLHRNPCARKVWELREDRLARSRAALDPNSDSDSDSDESYVEKIMSVLRILDDTSPG